MSQCQAVSVSGRRCSLDEHRGDVVHSHSGPEGWVESWVDEREPIPWGKLWLVVIKDKELADEPDVGVCIIESDDESAAHAAGAGMLSALATRGRHRCVARCTQIERGKFYRASVWFRPPPRVE